jgi:hypothetical protein
MATGVFALVFCAMAPSLIGAEDPARRDEAAPPASSDARIGALEETIRQLEARIRELEGKGETARQPGSANGRGNAPADATSASTAPPGVEAAKADTSPAAGSFDSFFGGIVFSGFVDGYYGYNFNRPASRKTGLRNFDVNHNQFSLNLIEIALERRPSPLGFRVDFNLGDSAKLVHASEPAGSDVYQYLQQAYVSYKAPVGNGLTVDFGKYVTHMGAEVIESHANMNYSRSLLFAWTIPYYHFGARVTYPINSKLSVAGLLVNGWNNVVDNNGGKSFGLSVNVTPHPKINVIQNYIIGAEQPENSHDRRQVLDSIITVNPTDKLTLAANYDYGFDRFQGERVRYQGVAGYVRYAFTPWFAIAPRAEWFDDPQGFSTGLAQSLRETTLTTEFKLNNGLIMRAEYRRDWSNRPFFEKRGGGLSRNQTTATLGVMYLLGSER